MAARDARNRLSELDVQLIARLQVDARRPNTEIARELHVAESTVRRRIEALTREGYIQIAARTDPFKVGFTAWAVGEVQTDLRQREAVARRLAKCPEVSWVALTTGAFQLLFTAVFRSNEEFDAFITKSLARIPGIQHVTTASILRLMKRTFAYGVPVDGQIVREQPVARARRRRTPGERGGRPARRTRAKHEE